MRKWGFLMPLLLPLLMIVHVQQGGAWTWAPVLFVFVVIPALDLLVKRDPWNPAPEEALQLEADPFYRRVLHAWVPVQLGLLAWLSWRSTDASALEYAGIVVSAGVITGALGITIAHELGHKLATHERWMARVLLMSVCYMHFHLEHNKGHHARVGTAADPASAREGQSLFAFLPQTLLGSFTSAWHFEAERLGKLEHGVWHWRNQVLWGVAGSFAMLGVAALLGGARGAAFFLGQSAVAILLLESVNYVEHYGLRRAPREGGGYERVSVLHSWNASERCTNWFLFNLQRHSHHHIEHHRRYQVLRHFDESPQLPTGYAGMVLLAWLPPLWFSVMNRRLKMWRDARAAA